MIEDVHLTSLDELDRVLRFVEDLVGKGFSVAIYGDLNITVNTAATNEDTTTVEIDGPDVPSGGPD